MRQQIAPIPCRPWTLNGLSERLIVSHYENNYGGAVRSLNAIRDDLRALDLATAPGYLVRCLKREELNAMGSVALHELYFGNLGGDGKLTAGMASALEDQFGSVDDWRREFVAAASAMRGGSGWVLLNYSRRDRRLSNVVGFDHTQSGVDAAPVLALDMYEHAYAIDFGANATAYVDAFMRISTGAWSASASPKWLVRSRTLHQPIRCLRFRLKNSQQNWRATIACRCSTPARSTTTRAAPT